MQRVRLAGTGIMALLVAAMTGCAGTPAPSVLPHHGVAETVPGSHLVWVGTGTSYRFSDVGWTRTPEQDYEFLVSQRRFAGHWESLKVQSRTHPEYDGAAGPADQTHFFRIEMGASDGADRAPVTLHSTYGDGTGCGTTDLAAFTLEFDAAGVSRFAPYNRFRITQRYLYMEGLLLETVELFKAESDGSETPFVRIEERATLFDPRE